MTKIKRFLISGAAGFVGSNLVYKLEKTKKGWVAKLVFDI